MKNYQSRQSLLKLSVGTLLIGFLLFTSLFVTQPQRSSSLTTSVQAVASAPALLTARSIALVTPDYLQTLKVTAIAVAATLPTASPYADWPADKAMGFQQQDLMRRAYGTAVALYPPPQGYQPPLPTALTTVLPVSTEPIRLAGAGEIYDDSGEGEFAKMLLIANQWYTTDSNRNIFVYAGSKFQRDDPQQGEILVVVYDSTTHQIVSSPTLYMTPMRAGLVRVIAAVGERLTLRAQDGTLFYFDVPTRQWIGPDGTPLPAPTPRPTAGP